jgi:uncharacterized protein YbjT (DUF2867 family)
MKILITGASGFIGGRLRSVLQGRGHRLRLAGRRPPSDLAGDEEWVALDLARPADAAHWQAGLDGIDVVINCVGILQERGGQTFASLHVDGPQALFEACVKARVGRVVQISALGADRDARSRYHLSKRAADEFLLSLPLDAVVVQPSLVFGTGGASARLFAMLASLPVLPLPAGGRQPLQPIHLDDLAEALARLVEGSARPPHCIVALVGPEPLELRDYLRALRASIGLRPAPVLSVPAWLMHAAAQLAARIPGSSFDPETWQMLQRGNVAPVDATVALLGRRPRAPDRFVPPEIAREVRSAAQLDWLLPILRVSIAAVWIFTGIVSLGVYPVAESYALLARAGVSDALAPWALYGAALLDLGLGIATLLLKRRRWLWLAQIALIVGYTAIISVRLPEFWLHPYGPVLKNLPMLAALWLLLELERDGNAR